MDLDLLHRHVRVHGRGLLDGLRQRLVVVDRVAAVRLNSYLQNFEITLGKCITVVTILNLDKTKLENHFLCETAPGI